MNSTPTDQMPVKKQINQANKEKKQNIKNEKNDNEWQRMTMNDNEWQEWHVNVMTRKCYYMKYDKEKKELNESKEEKNGF